MLRTVTGDVTPYAPSSMLAATGGRCPHFAVAIV
jgi:hypothetical protein